MKKNSEKEIEQIKQDRTIKVKTLVIALIWVATVLTGVIAGWNLRSYDLSRFESLNTQISQLKTEAQK